MNKASFVCNADESGFSNDPSRIRAIGKKGKPLCRVSGGSGRENTTVLPCVGADGSVLPPLIVFKDAAVQPRWISENGYPGTQYATSINGWMEEPQFFHWVTRTFVPYVEKIREEKSLPNQTALLLFDGHASHMSVRILEEAMRHNIILVKLPSDLTDKIQPLDKCVFGPVKTCWEKLLIAHGKKTMGMSSGRLSKGEFSELLGVVWTKAMKSDNIISGFKSTGIFPVDSSKFPINDFNAEDLNEYHDNLRKRKEADVSKNEGAKSNLAVAIVENTDPTNQPSTSQADLKTNETAALVENNVSTNQPSTSRTDFKIHEIANKSSCSLPELETLFFKKTEIPKMVMKSTNVRLKRKAYGEVLTTEDVLERLREAEAKKQLKGKNRKKQQPSEAGSTSNKRQKTAKVIKVKTQEKESSSSESEVEYENASDYCFEDVDNNEIDVEAPELSQLSNGDFVLVNFKGGKRGTTTFKYVCVIESIEGSEVQVMGLKAIDSSRQNFAVVENDVSYISFDQIIGVLPLPMILNKGERIFYNFDGKVPVIEQ